MRRRQTIQPMVYRKYGDINERSIVIKAFGGYNIGVAATQIKEVSLMEEHTCYDILCETISRMRKEADITQEQLADQLGISPQAISKWESKRSCPDIGLLPQIARIFGTTIDRLFGIESRAGEPLDPQPIGIVKNLPWPDNNDFHVVVYQGHRLRRFFIGEEQRNMMFHYNGPAQNVHCAVNLACEKNVEGHASAGRDVMILGDVKAGHVTAGKDVTVHGGVSGNVHAGKDCPIGRDVGGKVNAGTDVTVGGNAMDKITAGSQVRVGWAKGKIKAPSTQMVNESPEGQPEEDSSDNQ